MSEPYGIKRVAKARYRESHGVSVYRRQLALPVVALALAWGCSGDPSSTQTARSGTSSATGTGGGTSSDSGGTAGGGGATGGNTGSTSTSATSGAGGAPPGVRVGWVRVRNNVKGHDALAWFRASTTGTLPTYTSTTVGACTVNLDVTPPNNDALVEQGAGPITVSGGTQPLILIPNSNGQYPSISDPIASLFGGGETITVSAVGDVAPAFSTSLTASVRVDLTQPIKPSTGTLVIDRMSDLIFTWKNGGVGTVHVDLLLGDTTGINCSFPSAGGTGTLPAAALGLLPSNATGTFSAYAGEQQLLDVEHWSVLVSVIQQILWNGGSFDAIDFLVPS